MLQSASDLDRQADSLHERCLSTFASKNYHYLYRNTDFCKIRVCNYTMSSHPEAKVIVRHRVLTVGEDNVLLKTRAILLSRKYDSEVSHPADVLSRLRSDAFQLLLVCHSVPHSQASLLVREVREAFPSLCIVRLLTVTSPVIEEPIANRLITIDYNPQIWLNAVDELLANV